MREQTLSNCSNGYGERRPSEALALLTLLCFHRPLLCRELLGGELGSRPFGCSFGGSLVLLCVLDDEHRAADSEHHVMANKPSKLLCVWRARGGRGRRVVVSL